MQTSTQSRNFLERILFMTGGWYTTAAIIFVQFTASITILLGIVSERINAEYPSSVLKVLNKLDSLVLPIVFVLQISVAIILARTVSLSLSKWKKNPEAFGGDEVQKVWKSSHALTWKYALSTAIILLCFVVLPRTFLLNSTKLATNDQVIYCLISGLVSTFAFVPLSTVILDRLLMPVRQVFLPKDFSKQLAGLSKLKILNKTMAVVFFSLIVTTLLIAPIGYHQTTKALYTDSNSQEVLLDLQVQSIVVSTFAIIFAFGLTYLFAQSISDPLSKLMELFNKVENGDLTTRAPVISSDETSQLSVYFNRMVARLQELQSDLEKKVDERTSQLKALNEVSRVTTSILDPEELIRRVVNLITEEFGYYYSALYLTDSSGQCCELEAASGEVGRILKESGHQVKITTSNLIGNSIRSRHAQVALDAGDRGVRFNNPLLPYTRSEISLPLIVGNQILGALDVHSTQAGAFKAQDIETLQNMANQVAISLDNARLFQETRERLNELRNIQKQYLHEAWIDSNLPNGIVSLATGGSAENGGVNEAEFQITLRDQTIGKLSLETEAAISREDRNWIEAVATQTSLALENARLLEESQSMAVREKFVTEIVNKIWASSSMDGVLQTTVRELGQVLDATEATIELDIDENGGNP